MRKIEGRGTEHASVRERETARRQGDGVKIVSFS